MITFYLVPSQKEPDYDNADGTLPIQHGGIYYFLYSYLLQIKNQTGQMIDPQYTANFSIDMIPAVIEILKRAREAAETTPAEFVVHVGKLLTPVQKELYETISRTDLLTFIDRLIVVFEHAAKKCCNLLLIEE